MHLSASVIDAGITILPSAQPSAVPDCFDGSAQRRAQGVSFLGQIAVETRAAPLARRLDLRRPQIDRKFGNLPASDAPGRKTQSIPAPRCRLRTRTISAWCSSEVSISVDVSGAQKQCLVKGNRLDLEAPFAQHLTCGREHQLDITGCRKQGCAVDAVVLKIARRVRVDLGLPNRLVDRDVPEQRMHRALEARRAALLRFAE